MDKAPAKNAQPKTDSYCGLSSDDIIELQLRGYSVNEIAVMCGGNASAITNFMSERGKSLVLEPHEYPPAPELCHSDKIVIYRSSIAVNGGSRRISRVSLPIVQMHVRQIEAMPCA